MCMELRTASLYGIYDVACKSMTVKSGTYLKEIPVL